MPIVKKEQEAEEAEETTEAEEEAGTDTNSIN